VTALEIGVVGGSLGGLTAACLLRDAGHDVTIWERSPRELEQRGAGIGFLEATYRYLIERTDLSLDQLSIHTGFIRYLDRDGSVEHESTNDYLFSSWNAVYRHLLRHWGTERYLLGHDMTDFATAGDLVTVAFSNGSTQNVDLLVCADGVGSTGRRALQPDADQSYAGYVAWRGMVPEAALSAEQASLFTDAITYYVYANSHILVYPIPGPDGSVEPGERLMNFVWYRNYRPGGELDELLTDRDGIKRLLSLPPGSVSDHPDAEVRAHAAARLPPPIAALVDATAELFVQVVYDIEVDQMAFGRVCLLGDSAFAVRPHAAAGTAKAAEDAWVLSRCLTEAPSVEEALEQWQTSQLKLGRDLLARTRAMGRRSQVDNTWTAGDPDFIFGLHAPGN